MSLVPDTTTEQLQRMFTQLAQFGRISADLCF